MSRIKKMFEITSNEKRSAFGTFLTAGDPNIETSEKLLQILAENDVDFIEIGMPFSDPMADGPAIQASSLRSIKNGISLEKTFKIVKNFRKKFANIPVILMGYYNPIYIYGNKKFLEKCEKNGVDGLIIVDLPPEEDQELYDLTKNLEIDFIRLITPTTKGNRLKLILKEASGFVYYVSVAGITGTKIAKNSSIKKSLVEIRKFTKLPIVTGFGIRSPEQAKEIGKISDAIVIGSKIIGFIENSINSKKMDTNKMFNEISKFCKRISFSLKNG